MAFFDSPTALQRDVCYVWTHSVQDFSIIIIIDIITIYYYYECRCSIVLIVWMLVQQSMIKVVLLNSLLLIAKSADRFYIDRARGTNIHICVYIFT